MTQPITNNDKATTTKETTELEPAFLADLELSETRSAAQGALIKGGYTTLKPDAKTWTGTLTLGSDASVGL